MTENNCQMPDSNPTTQEIFDILKAIKNIAIIGISTKPVRDSYKVAQYLLQNGYKIIPINPIYQEVLGEKCYQNLEQVPEAPDVVVIFRKPEFIPPIVDEAVAKGAKVVWMQLGLAHNEAAAKARDAGLKVIMNKCIKKEHEKM